MNRAKPYKFFFVLAVMVAGVICVFIPEKKVAPVANISEVAAPSGDNDSSSLQSDSISSRDNMSNK